MNRLSICRLVCFTLLPSFSLYAQEKTVLQRAKDIELTNLNEGAMVQKKIDEIDDQRMQLLVDYRSTLKQFDGLKKYNDQMRTLIDSQMREMNSLKTQINRITGLEREIIPHMRDMLDTLAEFIELDVPFLIEERRKRVKNLQTLMDEPGITNSEKYRRILEAYQIENDYGRHIEAYEGNLDDDSDVRIVTFLKIGRVSYMYQTMDGEQSYFWNKALRQWQRLDNNYNNQIRMAIRMARDQIPPNLLFVPVKAPDNV